MSRQHLRWAVAFAATTMTAGCALTSKSEALDVRYFSPQVTHARLTSSGEGAPAPAGPVLRLGRVTSGKHLRERLVYRDTAWEVGFYEDRRWTERPEVYVRQDLEEKLFEQHGLRRILGGAGPILDVEVIAFEELRMQEGRAGRVQLKIVLHDDRRVLVEDTITVDRPAASPKPEAIVAALAEALSAANAAVATRVAAVLASASPDPSAPSR